MADSDIQIANERMSIVEACNELGMGVENFNLNSLKFYCPFGNVNHMDAGDSKAFRIYPATNSAWCFAGCGYFTPVKLIAMNGDMSEQEAAEKILETTGYVAPHYDAQWDALTAETVRVNTEDLAEALKIACARMDKNWESRQFDDAVAKKLRACFTLLGKVHTEEDATQWLDKTKQIMRTELGE